MKITKLIIVRHGNTFKDGETPRRVGGKTDIKLVETGKEQAKKLGLFFKSQNLIPDIVYSSTLKRTSLTSRIILDTMGIKKQIKSIKDLNEIDYGEDENKTEDEVIKRVGKEAIDNWNKKAIVPKGWNVDPEKIKKTWKTLSSQLIKNYKGKVILIVTSNGIARFSPYILKDPTSFIKKNNIKIKTGAFSILENKEGIWNVTIWNKKP